MSCDASVIVVADAASAVDGVDLARRAVIRLTELEQRWSRFLPTSELSGLNRAGGSPRTASADTVRLVEALAQAWHITDGAFDPTLLGTLVELGYAASRDDATQRTSLDVRVHPRGRPAGILVDRASRVVQLPTGTTLDPGGLGKGLAADIVTAELLAAGAAGALVEIGGDLRVVGRPPEDDAWTVAIAPTAAGERSRIVRLSDGGVATSSSRLRTWQADGRGHHHLISPRTRRSTATDVVSCTVLAGSAASAEAFTKVAFVEGRRPALDVFEQRSLAASITTDDGVQHTSSSWANFCR
jgi:thiamine biosynthesis lipoprotein